MFSAIDFISCFQTLLLIPDRDGPHQGSMNPFRESRVATAVPPLKILFTLAMRVTSRNVQREN